MKIKKGTEVRIRRTNEIATIEEVELIRWGGEVKKYCHLKIEDDRRHLWMLSDELTEVKEYVTATFHSSCCPEETRLGIGFNWKTQKMDVLISASLMGKLADKTLPPLHEMTALTLLQAIREKWGELNILTDFHH